MLNHSVFMGRLCADPELRRTQSGIAVTSFAIAVDRDYNPEGKDKEVDFIDCVAWRKTAEFVANYFGKGRMIAIAGRMQTRNYTDRDGKKHKAVECVADTVYFADSKRDREEEANEAAEREGKRMYDKAVEVDDDGELPF